jgi:hypothetical protein
MTVQRTAIIPAEGRENALIPTDPGQVIWSATPRDERSYAPFSVPRRARPNRQRKINRFGDGRPTAPLSRRADVRRQKRTMKITVNVDCTPLEARQFMGLPDVEPMQKAAMAQIEKRMMTELERYTPEALFKAWLPIAGMNAEWLQELLKRSTS